MLEPRACSIFPPALQVLIDAHLVPQDACDGDNGIMAQGGLKKKSEKFSFVSKSAKAKSAKHSKPLGPKKGGIVLDLHKNVTNIYL